MAGILWNYLLGYVIIEIKGGNLERFLNHAVHCGMELWEIKRTGAHSVCAHISMADFYGLRRLVREQGRGVKVSILSKRGLPISLMALRARTVLLVGWVVVLALIAAASRCVWLLSIEGCDVVEESRVHAVINGYGVAAGTPRRGIAPNQLAEHIMAEDPAIAWAGVELEGVIMRVSIIEAQTAEHPSSLEEPCSIYASRDGVITDIVALNGRAMVHEGDVVQKGDLLINGYMGDEAAPGSPVAARGSVTAQTTYVLVGEQGGSAMREARTGAFSEGVRLSMPGLSIQDSPEHTTELQVAERRSMHNCFLPLTAERLIWYETELRSCKLSTEQQQQLALEAAEARIADIPHDAVMLSKLTRFERMENGAIRAIITIITEEDICERRAIYAG